MVKCVGKWTIRLVCCGGRVVGRRMGVEVAKNYVELTVHRPTKAKVSNGGSYVSIDGKSPENADLRSPLGRSHRHTRIIRVHARAPRDVRVSRV